MGVVTYYNGEFVSPEGPHLPMDERGHQFGDGVYEVVRVYGGRPFLLQGHLERLERSLHAIGIRNPMTNSEWIELIQDAIRRSGEPESLVYWQVTRGIAVRAHLFPDVQPAVSLSVRPLAAKSQPKEAFLLCLPDERWANVYIKTINLLPNVIAKQVAHEAGALEALLVKNGRITEGSSSNAWFVKDGVIYTHPANRYILGGITRNFVLDLAREAGFEVREEAITLLQLPLMDEVFMTGTTLEVTPIRRVVADRRVLTTLEQLPDDAPLDLLTNASDLTALWEEEKSASVAPRLLSLYREKVEKFRTYEVMEIS